MHWSDWFLGLKHWPDWCFWSLLWPDWILGLNEWPEWFVKSMHWQGWFWGLSQWTDWFLYLNQCFFVFYYIKFSHLFHFCALHLYILIIKPAYLPLERENKSGIGRNLIWYLINLQYFFNIRLKSILTFSHSHMCHSPFWWHINHLPGNSNLRYGIHKKKETDSIINSSRQTENLIAI